MVVQDIDDKLKIDVDSSRKVCSLFPLSMEKQEQGLAQR